MKIFKTLAVSLILLMSGVTYAQTTITGTVVDETNSPLPGASVVIDGTNTGTSTDFNGKFTITSSSESGVVTVSFIGYKDTKAEFNGPGNMGTVGLEPSADLLDEIFITGTVDIAQDRKTPIAVSTIKAADIQEMIGTKEFPELLAKTPSVYATKQGGGFGDSRINVRGFDQSNTAVMINGMPVNDMENGWVYWSNWAGLTDITSAMQVQRGLGASKLAIASVGGTINVVTNSSEKAEGGSVAATLGNDQYMKYVASYNTGLMESGFSASVLMSYFQGDGYVDGTKGQGSNYFIGLGQRTKNEKHNFQFIFTGAPQWHHQRSYAPSINDYIRYNPENNGEPDIRYNSDWGYLNGEEYAFRRNFYHKPVMSLNWEYQISDMSRLSTVIYGSWGRGGGTGEIGRINGKRQYQLKDANGLIPVDDIFAWNSGQSVPSLGADRTQFNGAFYNTGNNGQPGSQGGGGRNGSDNGISRRASMNSHNWYGTIINFNKEVGEYWNYDVGLDLRTYRGIHYRVVNDVLGADGYIDYDNVNEPASGNLITSSEYVDATASWNPFQNIKDQEKIDYYNDGIVNWQGFFGQLEYSKDKISWFMQGSVSNQGFQRIDYFNETPDNQKTDMKNMLGGNVKTGLNFRINENHNVFANTGYYSKQPLFDAVYINYGNTLNPLLTNEQIFGLELGYGYRSEAFTANLNLYRTSWSDRFESTGWSDDAGNNGTANYQGITEIHQGIEIDFLYKPTSRFSFNGMMSIGDWYYDSDVTATVFDNDQNIIAEGETLYLEGVKVGDAAQFTTYLGASYKFFDKLNVGANWGYYANLYADFGPQDFDTPDAQVIELPAYNLFDLRASYNFDLGKGQSIRVSGTVNNVFDTVYMSEADTNYAVRDGDDTFMGISTGNRVFFGWGRSWNTSIKYSF
ncbi:MAG: TonB-dependent receptor [Flavobacteriaceae bacterium]